MRPSRKFLRQTATAVLLFLCSLVFIPVGSKFFIELARERGVYDSPSAMVDSVVTWVASVVETWWFVGVLGVFAGATLALWVNYYLRSEENRQSVIGKKENLSIKNIDHKDERLNTLKMPKSVEVLYKEEFF